jgi:excisionase family DNA binding protein
MSESASEQYLSVKEVAALLRVSPATIRVWIRRGYLPALQPTRGAALRIPRSSLSRLIRP